MTQRDAGIAVHIGRALERFGRVHGTIISMKDLIDRELGEDYLTEEFRSAVNSGLGDVEKNLLDAMKLLGQGGTDDAR